MGTFAWIFKEKESKIPKNKNDEFAERVEKIFQNGGMMNIEWIQLYGKKIPMLRKVEMQENGMDFCYNYFADEIWENAGFNKEECCVWSGKIGWCFFHKAVVAAYVLEEQYIEDVCVAMVDADPVTSWGYIGWINYLFGERYLVKNYDSWKLFETIHYSEGIYVRMEWFEFGCKRYAFIAGCEVSAVLHGYKKAIELYENKERGELEELILQGMKMAIKKITAYQNNCKQDRDEQVQILIDKIRGYYKEDITLGDEDEGINDILIALHISDAPAFVVEVISEVYEADFWELWGSVRDVAKRKMGHLYGSEEYYVSPISTMEFFRQSSDDMIIYWKEGGDICFSEELQNWFKGLKEQYSSMLNVEEPIDNLLNYIVNLLSEVNENYYNILCFYDFFEETLEHMQDRRYQTLWRMYEQMIRDREMQKVGDVIFVPDGPEHEKEGVYYLREQPRRRLSSNWDLMEPDKKNNKARVTFRRYMALVANTELRNIVFCF